MVKSDILETQQRNATLQPRPLMLDFSAILFFFAAASAIGAPLHVPRVSGPPAIKDFLAGNPREAELTISDFRQYSPGDGVPVSQPTVAHLSYDDENLYLVFVCKDDPSQIRARNAKREAIMRADRITLSLDTFHVHRRAYWFDINPYGVQADGNVTGGVEDDTSWDSLWHSEAQLTDDGYVVLAAIPFRSIRYPSDEEQTWGLVIGRFIQRNNELACCGLNRPAAFATWRARS